MHCLTKRLIGSMVMFSMFASPARAAGAELAHDKAHHETEAEPFLEYAVDWALGFATFDTLSPGATSETPTEQAYVQSRLFATSLLLGAEHRIDHLTVGVRIPIVMGNVAPLDGSTPSGLTAPFLGNLELEASHHSELDPHWAVDTTLEFALPTAMGEEAPLRTETLEKFDERAVVRGQLLRAAEFSRGSLDSTLFEPGRVGFIPKLAFEYRSGALRIRPQVKLETLVSTKGTVAEPLILELITGFRASYTFAHLVEPNVHVWANITLTDHVERDVDVVLVEPGVRFHLGRITPNVSVVLPVFGRLVTDTAIGVRVGITGEL